MADLQLSYQETRLKTKTIGSSEGGAATPVKQEANSTFSPQVTVIRDVAQPAENKAPLNSVESPRSTPSIGKGKIEQRDDEAC